MRCKTCDYRLWNLKSRTCPECGTPFLPSEFQFNANSVAFCCPHCSQDYYGTDEDGHLVPKEFNCVSCGNYIHMDEMVLRPTSGVDEKITEAQALPWLKREEKGVFKSWFSTTTMSMIRPSRVMELSPVRGSGEDAWSFAALSLIFIYLLVSIPISLFSISSGPAFLGTMCGIGCGTVIVGLIVAVVWGAITHGLLLITGKTEGDIGRTFQAFLYSFSVMILSCIPCLGYTIGPIWWTISAATMVATGQRVSGLRACFAVLVFPLFLLTTLFAWNLYITSSTITNFNTALTFVENTAFITESIVQHAEENDGDGPEHALVLAQGATIGTYHFSPYSFSNPVNINVSSNSLASFDYLAKSQRNKMVQNAVKSLPANTIAYRVGDYVFTYHGINLLECDPDLWIVILSPDPVINPNGPQPESVCKIGTADASTISFNFADLPEKLKEQNRLRAQAGLPPLPDPATITENKPAVGAAKHNQ